VRNDGSCRDHFSSQMACKNPTVIRCRLQIMQNGTARCEHWKFAETYAHINNARSYNGMVTTVTAAHHFIWRQHLYASMQAVETPKSKLWFITPDKEHFMNTLWQVKEFEQICIRASSTEKAAEIEKRISVKEYESKHHDFDPTTFYKNQY